MVNQSTLITLDDPFKDEVITAAGISYADFLRQFDGQHAEWHEGRVILVMSGNNRHQIIFSLLDFILRLYLGLSKIGTFRLAPFAMNLGDDTPKREPDIMIILNENLGRIKNSYLEGPADIAIEIVSPESIARDYGPKFQEYRAGGVREYWIIDPERRVMDVHLLGQDQQYQRLERDSQGRVVSQVLPDFAFSPEILWREEEPAPEELIALVQHLVGAAPQN